MSEAEEPKRRTFSAGRIAIAAFVLALVLGVIIAVQQSNARQNEYEPFTFTVGLTFDHYPTGTTQVPVRISGRNFTGSAVNELRLMSPSRINQIKLLRGNYTVSVPGSPVTATGGLYAVDSASYDISIGVLDGIVSITDASGTPTNRTDAIGFSFTLLDPHDITDEQLAAAQAWMNEVGLARADEYLSAAQGLREAREAELVADAKEQKRIEEERKLYPTQEDKDAKRAKEERIAEIQDGLTQEINPETADLDRIYTLVGVVRAVTPNELAEDGTRVSHLYLTFSRPLRVGEASYDRVLLGTRMANELTGESVESAYDDYEDELVSVEGVLKHTDDEASEVDLLFSGRVTQLHE